MLASFRLQVEVVHMKLGSVRCMLHEQVAQMPCPILLLKVSFMGMWPGHSHRAYIQKDPTFGLMLYCHCLEILNHFSIRSPSFSFCSGLHKLYSQSCSCQITPSLLTCIYDCMGSFQWPIDWRKKFELGLYMILARCWHYLKMDGYKTVAPRQSVPEGQWWKSILSMYRVIHLSWKRRLPMVGIYTDSCIVDSHSDEWSVTWQTDDKEAWERGIWIAFSEWAHNVKMFVPLSTKE